MFCIVYALYIMYLYYFEIYLHYYVITISMYNFVLYLYYSVRINYNIEKAGRML